ncbi:hypothetical protein ON010_g13132 [Phytophthora cinnamomi]|nr:hypothetical protein ON010_g13132 [Phytophthora cinnamomi]
MTASVSPDATLDSTVHDLADLGRREEPARLQVLQLRHHLLHRDLHRVRHGCPAAAAVCAPRASCTLSLNGAAGRRSLGGMAVKLVGRGGGSHLVVRRHVPGGPLPPAGAGRRPPARRPGGGHGAGEHAQDVAGAGLHAGAAPVPAGLGRAGLSARGGRPPARAQLQVPDVRGHGCGCNEGLMVGVDPECVDGECCGGLHRRAAPAERRQLPAAQGGDHHAPANGAWLQGRGGRVVRVPVDAVGEAAARHAVLPLGGLGHVPRGDAPPHEAQHPVPAEPVPAQEDAPGHDGEAAPLESAGTPYFFGEQPSALDVAVFGHIVDALGNSQLAATVHQHAPLLITLSERIRDAYFGAPGEQPTSLSEEAVYSENQTNYFSSTSLDSGFMKKVSQPLQVAFLKPYRSLDWSRRELASEVAQKKREREAERHAAAEEPDKAFEKGPRNVIIGAIAALVLYTLAALPVAVQFGDDDDEEEYYEEEDDDE